MIKGEGRRLGKSTREGLCVRFTLREGKGHKG